MKTKRSSLCVICLLPIKQKQEVKRSGDGLTHAICFDIAVANLSSELEAYAKAHPELFERQPNRKWRLIEKRVK